ncbi:MAG: hypothetical protein K2J01_01500 [Clostridiales bacterium]|nr:hypothetical protein [Clostridiales bacterium]
MKKRLVAIFSLIIAFVLCFTLVACGGNNGGDNGKEQGKQDPPQADNTVSISVNDALDAVNGVLNAKGFTGTASYMLSTKNTRALTGSINLDKRGTKLKMASKGEEMIVDLQTGYVYYKHGNYYSYSNEFYANAFDYAQYLLASLKQEGGAKKINAVYDEQAKTVTFAVEKADSVNKYLEPLQNAYKKDKSIGDLLNDYCMLLFDKSFDAMYGMVENYVKNPKNTVGTLLNALKEKGVDVEAILASFGYTLPNDVMTAIKARPLNKLVVGAYNFIMQNLGDLMTLDEDDDDISSAEGGGMESLGMGLLDAMLNAEVSAEEIAAGLQEISGMVATVKNTFTVKSIVEMLKTNAKTADLYTVVKDGVKLTNATMTLTLTIGDYKMITGVKLDNYFAHNYKGTAAEGSILADNDYRATAEIVIDEYKTSTEDFVIACDPAMEYKTSIISLVYEVTDKDVSVYFEAGNQTVNMTNYSLYTQPLNGEPTLIENAAENAFRFDAETSSFVFDGALVKSALTDVEFGDSLYAVVYFDDDNSYGYVIALSYVNDDWQDIYNYLYEDTLNKILEFIGGHDAPNIGEIYDVNGKYCYVQSNDELDTENNYFVIVDGEIVEFVVDGVDLTDYAAFSTHDNQISISVFVPETEDNEMYRLSLYGTVYLSYINITARLTDVNGESTDLECDEIYAKLDVAE